jgi:hypothetical protein
MEARMERFRQLAATLALALPTGFMVFLSACGGRADAVGVTQPAVTIANYGVTSIVPDENSDLVTVNFESGTTVSIHFGGFEPGDPDQTATSSDGTHATLSALGGTAIAANWPVVTYYDTAGNRTVAGVAGELTASAELDKWAARGNSSALALVAYSFSVGMAAQGIDDLASFKMLFADVGATAPAMAKNGPEHANQVAPKCAPDADNGLPPNLDPDGPDPDDCKPLPPARQCLQNVVNTGWYPCVRNVLAALVATIATRLLWRIACGACLTFLKAAMAGGVIFFGSNPVGWGASALGGIACAACAIMVGTIIYNAIQAIRNCFVDRPPPLQCPQP